MTGKSADRLTGVFAKFLFATPPRFEFCQLIGSRGGQDDAVGNCEATWNEIPASRHARWDQPSEQRERRLGVTSGIDGNDPRSTTLDKVVCAEKEVRAAHAQSVELID